MDAETFAVKVRAAIASRASLVQVRRTTTNAQANYGGGTSTMIQDCRKVLAFLAILGVAFVVPDLPRAQAAAAGAGEFLESMTHEVFTTLENSSLSQTDKEQELRNVFTRNFDVPAISRFVLGRHWRSASEGERLGFIEAFEEMNARKFLELVGDFSEEMFSVGTVQQDAAKPNLFLVNTKVAQSQGESLSVDWRVRNQEGQYRVIDVVVEGMSMGITLRQEYGAVIKTHGVDGLVGMMRKKRAEIQQ
jgi:phospholipid transport system substrate-binding protein